LVSPTLLLGSIYSQFLPTTTRNWSYHKMNFKEYQEAVTGMPLYDDPALGLPGEVGEVLELIKKDRRPGDRRKEINKEDLTKELGDILWYLTILGNSYGIDLMDVATTNVDKLTKRHKI